MKDILLGKNYKIRSYEQGYVLETLYIPGMVVEETGKKRGRKKKDPANDPVDQIEPVLENKKVILPDTIDNKNSELKWVNDGYYSSIQYALKGYLNTHIKRSDKDLKAAIEEALDNIEKAMKKIEGLTTIQLTI